MTDRELPSSVLRSGEVRVRIGFPPFTSWLLRRRVIAITFGRSIWIHPNVLESTPGMLQPILRHELVHVEQYRRDGTIPFLGRYLSEYIRGRLAGLGHYDAYLGISYEREAHGVESLSGRCDRVDQTLESVFTNTRKEETSS